MKQYVLLVGLLALGCREEVNALVNCAAKEGPTVECTVKQVKGKSEMEVCWQFKSVCANKASLETERTCTKLKDGGEKTVTIATDKIKISGACEGQPNATIEGMTINGQTVEVKPM